MRYRLGLDLGANSLGWAVLELQPKVQWYNAEPVGIMASGVRMFDAGVDGSIEQGKDSSRGAERRQARQTRRQTWRRQYRKSKLFGLLQRLGHLPKTESREPDVRDAALKSLDESLTVKWCPEGDIDAHQKMPYLLRAAALDQLLEPHELGRALYHLGQRRGYKANRKTDIVDDEESGKVAAGISTLDRARYVDPETPSTQRTLAQTVRDEFGQVNGRFVLKSEDSASPTRGRIRKHYTSRKMYYDEFIALRDAQLRFGTSIQMGDWRRIEKALFHQRPLKSQKHLVGRCTLEKDKQGRGRRRCTIAMLEFQEFRLLQTVNHLRIVLPGQPSQPISDEQRKVLIDHLQIHGDLLLKAPTRRSKTRSSTSVESLLDLPKGTGFSLTPFQDAGDANDDADEDDDKKLIGNRTAAKLRPIFGDRWNELTDSEREQLILQVLYISNPDSLKKLAIRKWQLSPEAAEGLSRVTLEEGFGGLSRMAIRKLLPELRNALSYGEARKKIYPDSFKAAEPRGLLPPLSEWNDDVRNPAVIRALTEVRKVVNAIVREYGKPEQIHMELARDLKRSRKERQEIWKKNEDQRRLRDKAAMRILKELGVSNPRRDQIDKWLLADECNWECAYTGKSITPRTLEHFDVEHIFPRQYLDDSFANKTLCDHDFNRNRKKNRLPSEVLSGEDFDAVIARVKRFNGSAAGGKLKRFQQEDVSEDFVARQLNDTRYNARLAADFLGTLYGGRSDADGHQRIVTPTGNLTWILRTGWGLNSILSDTDDKDRRDNRHHAVDAVCIALATQKTINLAADLAKKKFLAGERFNRFLQEMPKKTPWGNFVETVQRSIHQIIVSHRPTRRIAGPLHAETNYSKAFVKHEKPPTAVNAGGKGKASRPKPPVVQYRVRKSLDKLTEKDILSEAIADPNVRAAVQQKYEELCALATTKADKTPARMWSDLSKIDNFPRLPASAKRLKKGESTLGSPIFKVRLVTDTKPRAVGKGARQRQVASGKDSNYATMIYAIHDKDGKEIRWEHEIITRLDAHLRLSANGGGRGRRTGAESDDNNSNPPERILMPRAADEIRDMAEPPFKLKAGESLRFQFALVKNDMVELDGAEGTRCIYRVQSISSDEIMLCEHTRSSVGQADRTEWNRIRTVSKLRSRNLRQIAVTPLGTAKDR
jgi:CRISPR-associated endonuclease Csn1